MDNSVPKQNQEEAREFFCQGVGKFLDGRYDDAQVEFSEALRLDPMMPLAYCYLGIICLEKNLIEDAFRWCEHGLELDGENSYLHYCLGVVFERKKNYSKAIDEYRTYLKNHPHDSDCLFSLACVLELSENSEEAISCYKKAIHFDKLHFKALYNLALIFGEKGENQEAMHWLKQCIDANPSYWNGWVKLGYYASQNKQWQDAAKAYLQAATLRPEVPDSHYNLGLCYLTIEKPELAICSFQRTLQLREDADASFYLAVCYLDTHQEELAIQTLHRTIGIDLDHEKAHYLLGRLYFLKNELAKGNRELDFLVKKKSDFANTLLNCAPKKKRKKA